MGKRSVLLITLESIALNLFTAQIRLLFLRVNSSSSWRDLGLPVRAL